MTDTLQPHLRTLKRATVHGCRFNAAVARLSYDVQCSGGSFGKLEAETMDPLTQLYERLRAQAPARILPVEPPSIEEWLTYWNDDDTDLGNLRAFEHWLSRSARAKASGAKQG